MILKDELLFVYGTSMNGVHILHLLISTVSSLLE